MLEVDARTRILEAAASLLAESPERDVSTRAVCEAANVGAPMLYRLFGDKNGLLAAVVDYRFGRYMTDKRNRPPAADPVDDLYVAWDNHVAFALENPTIYRIVYSPSLAKLPAAADEAHRLLVEWMDRCAEAGKLKLPPDVAAQTFTAACVGVTLSLLSQPDIYDDPDLSDRVRDAIIRELIVETGDSSGERDTDILKPAAVQMAALLRRTPTPLSEPEVLMMLQWLNTISTADQVQDSQRIHSARNALMSTRRREAAPTSEDATKVRVR
jgi:AcrR family transcriptional regulator